MDTQMSTEPPASSATGVARARLLEWLRAHTFAPDWLPEAWRSPLAGYAVAAASTLVVAVLTALLATNYPDLRYLGALGFLQILALALTWGLGPALLAAVAGAMLQAVFMTSVVDALDMGRGDQVVDEVVGLG